MFLIHHRIYDPGHRKSIGGYRNPSQDEASKMFQIPMLTMTTWWRKRDEEKFKKAVDRVISWPLLKKELYARFLEAARRLKKPITTGWFRRVSREIFRELYPSHVGVFTFSNGWYIGFKMRNSIVRRRITNQATRSPEKYRGIVCSFPGCTRRGSAFRLCSSCSRGRTRGRLRQVSEHKVRRSS
ncbi:hypothetical protein E4U12_000497 [Claviceps purpurea]|nr:hypothetical protein E4U12_000497 [Claviceps purpurea]